jgi:hypothetical protein
MSLISAAFEPKMENSMRKKIFHQGILHQPGEGSWALLFMGSDPQNRRQDD